MCNMSKVASILFTSFADFALQTPHENQDLFLRSIAGYHVQYKDAKSRSNQCDLILTKNRSLSKTYSVLGTCICLKSANLDNFDIKRKKINISSLISFTFQTSIKNQTITLQSTTLQLCNHNINSCTSTKSHDQDI